MIVLVSISSAISIPSPMANPILTDLVRNVLPAAQGLIQIAASNLNARKVLKIAGGTISAFGNGIKNGGRAIEQANVANLGLAALGTGQDLYRVASKHLIQPGSAPVIRATKKTSKRSKRSKRRHRRQHR